MQLLLLLKVFTSHNVLSYRWAIVGSPSWLASKCRSGKCVMTIISGARNGFIGLGNGEDQAFGGQGNDNIFGGDDNDELNGRQGDDGINGQGGDDLLFGGTDTDRLNGGPHDVGGDFCGAGETLIDCEVST